MGWRLGATPQDEGRDGSAGAPYTNLRETAVNGLANR